MLKLIYNGPVYRLFPTLPCKQFRWYDFQRRNAWIKFKYFDRVLGIFWFFRILKICGFVCENNLILKVVHLTFPPHIFFVQVKSGTCYIAGQWGQVKNKIKYN